MKTQNW